MKLSIETITPKKAADWLAKNKSNRPVRDRHADRLAGAMTRGEWQSNGETIKFNCEDVLIDGQHRLLAVVKSGVTIQAAVVRGLEPTAFDTIDQGQPRTIADVFSRRGEVNCCVLAAAIRWVKILTADTPGTEKGERLTPDQANAILAEHAGLREVATIFGHHKARQLMPVSLAAALYYLMGRKHKADAERFWSDVAEGVGLKRTDPAYVLREKLLSNRKSSTALRPMHIAAFAIKSWNAFRAGEQGGIKYLKFVDGEKFPKIK